MVQNGSVARRAVRTGRLLTDLEDAGGKLLEDQVEILSGLGESELVLLPAVSQRVEGEAKTSSVTPVSAAHKEVSHE